MTLLADIILNKARENLTLFMIRKAKHLSDSLPFGYIESDDAPNTYEELWNEYKHCNATRQPFRVYSGASDNTIYTSREGNWAFRFWHDVTHIHTQSAFDLVGEARVASVTCDEIAKVFGKTSVEYKLFALDTIGQSAYNHAHGKFPDNQLEFVRKMLISY